MMDSTLPFGDRKDNLSIISTRTLVGSWSAPIDAVWRPAHLSTKIGKYNRAVHGSLRADARAGPYCDPPGLERVVYALPVDERRENWGQPLRHTGAHTCCENCPASVKSEGNRTGTVRKWPKYPFLLAVLGTW